MVIILKKVQICADEEVAWIELKLLFSTIGSENMAKNRNVSPLLSSFKHGLKLFPS